MICRRCRTENPDTSRYCSTCGALLTRPQIRQRKAIPWYVIAGATAMDVAEEPSTKRGDFDEAIEKARKNMWEFISKYEYGSDPVMDAYLANYGMSTDPDNPLSFWNPCYVMYYLFYIDFNFCQ